ncbi:MAG: TolC family protein [Acidobacteria bacterium]|nr:TolC family protein [Acidobacteriota bacterium]
MRFFVIAGLALSAMAQEAVLGFKDAVQRASERYPSIRVSRDQVNEAAASITLARTAFLPRVDGIAQVNRATANNVFGLLLPNSAIPPISGPQIDGDQGRNVFGTALGVLVSWEPFDFGRRQADVDVSAATKARAEAAVARTKLDVAAAAADAYLTALAAEQAVAAAKAGITRYKEFEKIIEALTKAELRPGADLARIQAESILVETQVVRAEQAVAQAKALLEQYVGAPVKVLDAAPFLRAESVAGSAAGVNAMHPQLLEQQRSIEEIIARMKAIDKGWYPKFSLQAAAFGRGTGARVTGPFAGGAHGLYPDRGNWAVGFTATLPVLDYKQLRARKEVELQRQSREQSRKELVERELSGKLAQANAQLDAARRIAVLTPRQVQALQTTLEQAQARYRSGLGTLLEVADAQRQLTQAEIDASLAKLSVWRAELAIAYAQGDLEPFLARLP